MLALPSGRLTDRRARVLVACAYVIATVGELAWVLFADAGIFYRSGCDGCALPLLSAGARPKVAEAFIAFQRVSAVVVAVLVCALLFSRWRTGTLVQRRALAPVLGFGALTGLLLAVSITAMASGVSGLGRALQWPYEIAVALIPIAFLVGVLVTFLRRALGVTRLLEELDADPSPERVRTALARALGDDRLSVVYWLPDAAHYVDSSGTPVDLSQAAGGRASTAVELDGRSIAAVMHDSSLGEESASLVRAAGRATALWIERARLEAERSARLVELRESRARLVEAADAERRRIERDLHDGAQQRLSALLVQCALGRREGSGMEDAEALLENLERGLADALADLRALAAGILPPVLTDHGLTAAVEELAVRSPVPITVCGEDVGRLPERVEAAGYFVVAEALTNVLKHANAHAVVVRLARENGALVVEVADDGDGGATLGGRGGLRGLADRVGAFGGLLTCAGMPEGGTLVRAEIPCAS
jgi:signal transduction histidine kinase